MMSTSALALVFVLLSVFQNHPLAQEQSFSKGKDEDFESSPTSIRLQELEERLDKQQEVIEKQERTIETLRQDLVTFQRRQHEENELTGDLEDIVEDNSRRIQSMREDVEIIRKECHADTNNQSVGEEMQREIQQAVTVTSTLQAHVMSFKDSMKDIEQQLLHFNISLDSFNIIVGNVEDALEKSRHQIGYQKKRLNNVESSVDSLKSTLRVTQGKTLAIETSVTELSQQVSLDVTDLRDYVNGELAQYSLASNITATLQAHVVSFRNDLKEQDEKVRSLEEMLNGTMEGLQQEAERCTGLTNEFEEYRTQEKQRNEHVNKRLDVMETSTEDLKNGTAAAEAEILFLEEILNATTGRLSQLSNNLIRLGGTVSDLSDKDSADEDVERRMDTAIINITQAMVLTDNTINTLEQRFKQMTQNITEVGKQLDEVTSTDRREITRFHEILKELRRDYSTESEQIRKGLAVLEQSMQNVEQQRRLSSDSITSTQGAVQRLEEKISSLEEGVEQLHNRTTLLVSESRTTARPPTGFDFGIFHNNPSRHISRNHGADPFGILRQNNRRNNKKRPQPPRINSLG